MTLFEMNPAFRSWSLLRRQPDGALVEVLTRFPQGDVPEPPGDGDYFLAETTCMSLLTTPAWAWLDGRWQPYAGTDAERVVTDVSAQAATWPVGHQFTVAFRVEVPEQMTEFLLRMFSKQMIHGCTVERIDMADAAVLTADRKLKVSRLLRELQEALDGY